jgi:asparagine synthase (glutamine-hydrolysing)
MFAGIFYFDLRPISHTEAADVLGGFDAISGANLSIHRGPGMMMAGFDSVSTSPPNEGISSGCVCTWDGRLDNPRDIALKAHRPGSVSGGALAAALYAQEGWAGFKHLIGDWSLALWNPAQRSVVLASDFAGIRPLYYHSADDRLIWCTSLGYLASWAGVEKTLEDRYVADFLSRGASIGFTPYRDIHPVPPAHAICVSSAGIRKRRFWELPAENMTPYKREGEYEEHLRELFSSAVRSRLSARGPTCAELSGGLDSTSVVAWASRESKLASGAVPRIISVTYQDDDSADRAFSVAVESSLGLSATHFDLKQDWFVSANSGWGPEPAWWEPRWQEVAGRMQSLDSDVLLTGRLGDLIMGNWFDGAEQIAERLTSGHVRRGLALAMQWSRAQQRPVYSVLADAAQMRWAHLRCFGSSSGAGEWPGKQSFSRKLREIAGSLEIDRDKKCNWRSAHPGRRARLRALEEILASRGLQSPPALGRSSITHPFSHRPLIEFMLSVPSEIVYRAEEPRRLMRRAFRGVVPDLVLQRRSKASYNAAFRKALRPLVARHRGRVSEMRLVSAGYLDPKGLEIRLDRYLNGLACNEGQLRHIILLEHWLGKRRPHKARLPDTRLLAASVAG